MISKLYKEPDMSIIKKMRKKGAIMLNSFINETYYTNHVKSIQKNEFKDTGPLHLRYYQVCNNPSSFLLKMKKFCLSTQFVKWIQKVFFFVFVVVALLLLRFEGCWCGFDTHSL